MPCVMEWRVCPRFPDYEVSECGDLRRVTAGRTRRRGSRPKGFVDFDGYLRYALRDPGGAACAVAAHRLVAEAFIGPAPSDRHEVAHNNGSRVCHDYRNLRWALRKENHADIQIHGTSVKGERNGHAKITEADVHTIRREYRAIKMSRGARSVVELDRRFGLHRATIVDIATGRSWAHVPMPEARDDEQRAA